MRVCMLGKGVADPYMDSTAPYAAEFSKDSRRRVAAQGDRTGCQFDKQSPMLPYHTLSHTHCPHTHTLWHG
jgi:hypothetical protein